MLTGVKSMDLARRSLLMGAADFIQKPFNFTYLDRILEM
jgi:FixJ family two-component response regulator